MKRRDFLKQTSMASAAALAAPYILPSGRLFARTGSRVANHVVFVLFAGGIRNQEAVDMLYLDSQDAGPSGNVMPNMLTGDAPSSGLVYTPWTPIQTDSLASQGTLFRNMRYAQGPTGHYNGHTVAMTGNYTDTGLNLNINPEFPTVFEYYRKHSEPAKSALNSWWLSTELGPYPSLNYSRHPQYGPQYGANFLMPDFGVGYLGSDYFGGLQTLHPEEYSRVSKIKEFLDAHFGKEPWEAPGIRNTADESQAIQQLYLDIINGDIDVEFPLPDGTPGYESTGDLNNIAYAWQVINKFKPELTVINTTNVDVCHDNFSLYIELLHKADYGIGWLWKKIQEDPVMANDTILICMPEHGRNLEANGLLDANGLNAYDHTSDENSRDIFGLIVGPPDRVAQGQILGTPSSPIGESIDIVPTIAHILGFGDDIPPGFLPGRILNEAFI